MKHLILLALDWRIQCFLSYFYLSCCRHILWYLLVADDESHIVFHLCRQTPPIVLTHWGRVTHICVGNQSIIGSYNGLSPFRRQAIIWTNVGILLILPLGTNCNGIVIDIHTFSFNEVHWKMSSGKCRPFCLGLNMLIHWGLNNIANIQQTACLNSISWHE